MTTPVLVAVAHGSRDPRSAAAMRELVDVVRELRPGLDVRLAFLELSAPRLGDVLAAIGHGEVVVAPLLLGRAHHARVDVPRVVAAATARLPRLDVRVAEVLGPDQRLAGVALRRLAAAGADLADPRLGVVLAAAGSSHAASNGAVVRVAAGWARTAPWAGAAAGFASTGPTARAVPEAMAGLLARGARRLAVASWFLAPGLLPDRVARAARGVEPGVVLADPLGADLDVAQVVLDRHDAALRADRGPGARVGAT